MTVGNVRVEIVDGRCMGAGNCVDVAPEYFDQNDDDGTVVALRDVVDGADESLVRDAADVCPVAALVLVRP
ncbi:MAG: hypothetical protein ABS81_11015 [Pseudonocardia sp. SCN 72-86]|mgnify:CR=1 FL=1|nr:MAG: hypothetical protein ABS81_11015 [Pseudonocardia sp. SCN 72-86]